MSVSLVPNNALEQIPFWEWELFISRVGWEQGEHFALIGPTGCGKTTCAFELLLLRNYTTVFATKPKDPSLRRFGAEHDYKIFREWRNISPKRFPHRILWPDATQLESDDVQRKAFMEALRQIYTKGGWCVYFDELWYMMQQLNMGKPIKTMILQARSMLVSLLMSFQRPAWVPVEVYDQSTHLMFWRENDETNLSRISGIAYQSQARLKEVISNLPIHQALYVNTRTGSMVRTMAPDPKKGGVTA